MLEHYVSPARLGALLDEQYKIARHNELISDIIARAAIEGNGRFIVCCPPRHSKSETCSIKAPVWFLNTFPHKRIMLGSYGMELAMNFGRQVRNTIATHAEQLAVSLAQDSKAANRWNTSAGGGMLVTGMDGSATGFGGDLVIIDDPYRSMADAMSPAWQDRVHNAWRSTFRTRLEPGASVIIIQTLWTENDLALTLMRENPGVWTMIRLPALAEDDDILGRAPGEPLWPERYDVQALMEIKRDVGSQAWAALYQQRPAPLEGNLIKLDWLDYADKAPKDLDLCRWWDTAATESDGRNDPDYSVGALVGRDSDGRLWVVDIVRARVSAHRLEQLVRHTAKRDGQGVPIRMGQEPGSSGKSMIDYYQRHVLAGYNFAGVRETGSKVERAMPMSAVAEAGNLVIVRGDWNRALQDELLVFPNGAHDDQVDSIAGAWGWLCGVIGERQAVPKIWSL